MCHQCCPGKGSKPSQIVYLEEEGAREKVPERRKKERKKERESESEGQMRA